MATLAAGRHTTLQLPIGSTFTIAAAAGASGSVVRLRNGGEPSSPIPYSGSALKVGPYSDVAIFRLHSSVGGMEYTIDAPARQPSLMYNFTVDAGRYKTIIVPPAAELRVTANAAASGSVVRIGSDGLPYNPIIYNGTELNIGPFDVVTKWLVECRVGSMAGETADISTLAPLQLIGTKYAPGAGGEGDGLSGDVTHLASSSRHRHDMPNYDVWLEQIHYAGYYFPPTTAGETVAPALFNVKAAWENEGAASVVTVSPPNNSNRPEACSPGDTLIVEPAERISVPAASKPYSRQRVTVNVAAQQWPVNRLAHGSINSLGESDNQFGGAGADTVDAVGTFTGTTPAYSFGPAALIGRPKDGNPRPALIIFDDSTGTVSGVDASTGDGNYGDANGYAGKFERAIGSSIATMNVARATSQLRGFAASCDRVLQYVKYATDIMLPSFFNDWSAGRTATEILADFATIIGKIQAQTPAGKTVRLWAATSWPKPTATSNAWVDGGSTKNAGADAHRVTVNAAIRAGSIAGVFGYVELAAALEDGARAGFYKSNTPAYTTDGSHLTLGGNQLLQAPIDVMKNYILSQYKA